MRYPATFLDDLHILLKIFQLPEEVLIYAPKISFSENTSKNFKIVDHLNEEELLPLSEKVLINLSNKKLASKIYDSFDFILTFKSKMQHCEKVHLETFYFINSPDGSMRWIYPKGLKHPGFLSLYNSTGLKASIFQQVVKLAYQTQTQHLICSGKFLLYAKKENYVKHLFAEEDQSYSIFTGTVGPNRKAIIALHKENKTTHFIKIPLTQNAKVLINNEWSHLRCLGQFQFKNIKTPESKPLNRGIKLSNIKPDKYFHNLELQDLHFSALIEIYDQTTRYSSLCSLPGWKQSLDDLLFSLVNFEETADTTSLKIRQLIGKMYELSQQLDEQLEIPIAYSHGDFTPWNMYLSRDRLYLYDWEMASLYRPMLFDLFHFIFQTHVLIKKSPYKIITEAITEMRQEPAVRKLIGKYDIDFDLHYQLYLLINCAYYVRLYISQKRLHKQAFWLVDAWLEAFKELSEQKVLFAQSFRA